MIWKMARHTVATAAEREQFAGRRGEVTFVEDAWTRADVDIALHDEWFAFRGRRQAVRSGIDTGLLAALECEYSDHEIALRRLGWAVRQAACGAPQVAITAGALGEPGSIDLVRELGRELGVTCVPAGTRTSSLPKSGRRLIKTIASRLAGPPMRRGATSPIIVIRSAVTSPPPRRGARFCATTIARTMAARRDDSWTCS